MAESKIKRYKRYVRYSVQAIKESLKGLDFTMRDTHLIEETGGGMHGYSKTDDKHVRDIFRQLDYNKCHSLLDVGCGKGVVLREAQKFPFTKTDGFDIDSNLVRIAKKNFKILKMNNIRLSVGDATKFRKYNDYNVLYFFNPFDEELMDITLGRIFQDRNEPAWIILHNPVSAKLVEKYNCKEIARLYDKVKSYETRIYKWENY